MKTKHAKQKHSALVPVSDEMKHWSSLLEQEIGGWPDVSMRPMFGLVSFYRRKSIFAALPRTRALGSPSSIIMRFDPLPTELEGPAQSQAGLRPEEAFSKGHWLSLSLESAGSLNDALWWLNQAYQFAAPTKSRNRRPAHRKNRAGKAAK
jgi:predicted DNA-binding protein (MmcQ/YjbR family)